MGYEVSLKNAWEALGDREGNLSVSFLNNEYEVDFSTRTVMSLSCNIEAKDYYKILILHYLAKEDRVSDIGRDDWMSFKEMDGGSVYFTAFRKRAIDPIIRKYGDNPEALYNRMSLFKAQKMATGSSSISIEVFSKIKVGIVLWEKDEEFGADCNMLFNRSARLIFPTEDIAVLGGIIASKL
ncbi:MAG: DUF3786 domain-containing protein [Candidatus Omnitrophota bacterium]